MRLHGCSRHQSQRIHRYLCDGYGRSSVQSLLMARVATAHSVTSIDIGEHHQPWFTSDIHRSLIFSAPPDSIMRSPLPATLYCLRHHRHSGRHSLASLQETSRLR